MTPSKEPDQALAAIRAEKAFVKLPPAARDRVLAALAETRSDMDTQRRYARYDDRDQRIRNRNSLKSHLAPILKILADDVAAWDAMDWLMDRPYADGFAALAEVSAFKDIAQRLLKGAERFEPEPGRAARGELQLRTDLTGRAFYTLIETLESVSGPVRVSLGPRTRLLTRLVSYAVGFEVSVNTVKALVLRRNAK